MSVLIQSPAQMVSTTKHAPKTHASDAGLSFREALISREQSKPDSSVTKTEHKETTTSVDAQTRENAKNEKTSHEETSVTHEKKEVTRESDSEIMPKDTSQPLIVDNSNDTLSLRGEITLDTAAEIDLNNDLTSKFVDITDLTHEEAVELKTDTTINSDLTVKISTEGTDDTKALEHKNLDLTSNIVAKAPKAETTKELELAQTDGAEHLAFDDSTELSTDDDEVETTIVANHLDTPTSKIQSKISTEEDTKATIIDTPEMLTAQPELVSKTSSYSSNKKDAETKSAEPVLAEDKAEASDTRISSSDNNRDNNRDIEEKDNRSDLSLSNSDTKQKKDQVTSSESKIAPKDRNPHKEGGNSNKDVTSNLSKDDFSPTYHPKSDLKFAASKDISTRETDDNSSAAPSPQDQIRLQVTNAFKKGITRINLQLTPEHLGRVDVEIITNSKGKSVLSIIVQKPSTLELIKSDATILDAVRESLGTDLQMHMGLHDDNASNNMEKGYGNASRRNFTETKETLTAVKQVDRNAPNHIISENKVDIYR